MANYENWIDDPNPFLTNMPIVIALRHVRVVPATDEVVVEDPNNLPRYIRRIIDEQRSFPRRLAPRVKERNFPPNQQRKGPW